MSLAHNRAFIFWSLIVYLVVANFSPNKCDKSKRRTAYEHPDQAIYFNLSATLINSISLSKTWRVMDT